MGFDAGKHRHPLLVSIPKLQAQVAFATGVGPETLAGAHSPGEARSVPKTDRLEHSFRPVRRVCLVLAHLRFCAPLQQAAGM